MGDYTHKIQLVFETINQMWFDLVTDFWGILWRQAKDCFIPKAALGIALTVTRASCPYGAYTGNTPERPCR